MSESEVLSPLSAPGADVVSDEAASASAPTPARKRPKPGERREQILQALAAMLEKPGAERITTAALAAHLGVSEAALYRHFASKAQMFEGDRKSTRLNSSHSQISYAVFCLKKKKKPSS